MGDQPQAKKAPAPPAGPRGRTPGCRAPGCFSGPLSSASRDLEAPRHPGARRQGQPQRFPAVVGRVLRCQHLARGQGSLPPRAGQRAQGSVCHPQACEGRSQTTAAHPLSSRLPYWGPQRPAASGLGAAGSPRSPACPLSSARIKFCFQSFVKTIDWTVAKGFVNSTVSTIISKYLIYDKIM